MRECRARWLVLACFVLALSWLNSCGEDSTTCPTPKVCHDPGRALLGTWVIFEAWMGGNPSPLFVGVELEFRDDDTLMVYAPIDTVAQTWLANDSTVATVSTDGNNTTLLFRYEFEADTLNMREQLSGLDVYWRLYKE